MEKKLKKRVLCVDSFFFAKTVGLYTNKSGISTNPINYIHKVKFLFHILSLTFAFFTFFIQEMILLFWFGFLFLLFIPPNSVLVFIIRHNKMCSMKNAFKLGQQNRGLLIVVGLKKKRFRKRKETKRKKNL